MIAEKNLFVYGSLRENFDNEFARQLRKSGRLLGRAKVRGRLYQISDYPGLVLSDVDTEWVQGEVYTLTDPKVTYRVLDEYEGCGSNDPLPHEFERTVEPILLESGEWIRASIYIYTCDINHKQQISTGNFLVRH